MTDIFFGDCPPLETLGPPLALRMEVREPPCAGRVQRFGLVSVRPSVPSGVYPTDSPGATLDK